MGILCPRVVVVGLVFYPWWAIGVGVGLRFRPYLVELWLLEKLLCVVGSGKAVVSCGL